MLKDYVPLHPLLESILDVKADTFSPVDLARLLNVNRDTVSEAFRKGHIPNSGLSLRNPSYADGKYKRRYASKSTVIEWLWDSQCGERTMMRRALEQRAPEVLAALDERDRKKAADAAAKTSQAPSPKRRHAPATGEDDQQTQLQLFTA